MKSFASLLKDFTPLIPSWDIAFDSSSTNGK
jgi:hypothetical protein